MHEISPVLAGTFDTADYTPAVTNVNRAAVDDTSVSDTNDVTSTTATAAVDPRRYTKFDRTASESGTSSDFSFSDFLDMINPLEHIPVVSSIYRAVTNENIHPVARVAGDIMYGGLFGVASAIVGGLGAASDSMMVAETGHDVGGYVLASIFGDDKKTDGPDTQLAGAQTPAAETVSPTLASLAGAGAVPGQNIAAASGAVTTVALTAPSTAGTSATANTSANTMALPDKNKMYPLGNSKLPYGGVMQPVGGVEAQNMAMALSEGSHSMRMGNMIYTNPLMNGPHPLPVMQTPVNSETPMAPPSSPATNISDDGLILPPSPLPAPTTAHVSTDGPAAAANVATNTTASKSGPQRNPIPQNLIDDMVMMKAMNQYKGIATGPSAIGSSLDITN